MVDQEEWKRTIESRVSSLETSHAVFSVHMTNLEKGLVEIKGTLTWLARLIIGAILLAIFTFIVNGGLVIGQ